jgi:hypothetical protein
VNYSSPAAGSKTLEFQGFFFLYRNFKNSVGNDGVLFIVMQGFMIVVH